MKLYLEYLFHYKCLVEVCGYWWTVADRLPTNKVICPHCGFIQTVDDIESTLDVSSLDISLKEQDSNVVL